MFPVTHFKLACYGIYRLRKTQDLLYDSTRDFLELKFQQRGHEREWMNEKDRLLRQLDKCQRQAEELQFASGPRDGRIAGVSTLGDLLPPRRDVMDVSVQAMQALENERKKDEEIKVWLKS